LNRSSRRYQCKARHKSFIYPTEKRDSTYKPSQTFPFVLAKSESVVDDDDDDANFMEQAECFLSVDSEDVHIDDCSDGEDCQKLKKRLKNMENQMSYLCLKLSEHDSKKMAILTEEESKGPPLHW
jgi:alpha-mannosidase